jgi:hypothetical protein
MDRKVDSMHRKSSHGLCHCNCGSSHESSGATAVLEPAIKGRPKDRDSTDVQAGYGNCTVSGCECPAFMGEDQLCGNCGHNYEFHN